MKQSALEQKIDGIARPVVEDLGYRLVLVEYEGGILQLLAEDPATGKLGLEDCAKISRALFPAIEEADPIKGAYRLEISSPGIDRPLIDGNDYNRFKGFEAKIELDAPIEGDRRRYRGVIQGEVGGTISLLTDTGEVKLPLASVGKAKLVLTDELIKASKNGL